MKRGMAIEYLKCRAHHNVEIDFGVNGAIVTIVTKYEPADLTVHPPPELPRVGSFFSYRCLVFPKKCPQRKACAFRSYSG